MKQKPCHEDHLPRDGPDHRSRPEFLNRGDRGRVDEKLAIVGGSLNQKDPAVGAPKAPPNRLQPSDVYTRVFVVHGQDLVPAVVNPWPSIKQDWRKEVQLENIVGATRKIEDPV